MNKVYVLYLWIFVLVFNIIGSSCDSVNGNNSSRRTKHHVTVEAVDSTKKNYVEWLLDTIAYLGVNEIKLNDTIFLEMSDTVQLEQWLYINTDTSTLIIGMSGRDIMQNVRLKYNGKFKHIINSFKNTDYYFNDECIVYFKQETVYTIPNSLKIVRDVYQDVPFIELNCGDSLSYFEIFRGHLRKVINP